MGSIHSSSLTPQDGWTCWPAVASSILNYNTNKNINEKQEKLEKCFVVVFNVNVHVPLVLEEDTCETDDGDEGS